VRTPDEFASALVVTIMPLTPGRRAAACVWQASLVSATAVAVVLRCVGFIKSCGFIYGFWTSHISVLVNSII
jgi:hypothetical protein